MTSKWMIAGLMCVSLAAVAQQSDKKKEQPTKGHEVTAPRDLSTGQASGRTMNPNPQQPGAPRDSATAQPSAKTTGKTTAQDDWQTRNAATTNNPEVKKVSATDPAGNQGTALRESPSKASLGQRESPTRHTIDQVKVSDVDGDGKADKTAGSTSDVRSPRDLSTGQPTGKRQHPPRMTMKTNQAEDATKK